MRQFEEMQNFIRVVDAGSISRAAEQLGMAKSGVSRRLQELEQRLGVRLINRTTRRSSLTEAGQSYYDGAVKLLGDVSELDAMVAHSDASLSGSLRLAVPLSFGLDHLGPAIDEFMRLHPAVSMNIEFSDYQADLVAEGIDLALRISNLTDSSLHARRICPIRLILCASPGYIERHGEPFEPGDLLEHEVLHYQPGGRHTIRLTDQQGRVHDAPTRSRTKANNGNFLRDMAMAGHGIILTPTFISWQALASGDLQQILPAYRPPVLNAYAVYPTRRYLSRRARVFIDFLANRFGENPYWDQFC